ncbi:helix-turn-helix domain-containing protein [Rhodoferax sp. 4810]|nr:helix-turn-helix domain-containing protein [Rhodoferax jenense]
MKAAQWIDRVKALRGWDSDYRVAKELGLGRQTISTYRSKTSNTMDEDTAVKVAAALGTNPAIILADQAMERAKNEDAKSAWGSILERLGGAAAMVLVSVATLGMAPAPAHSGGSDGATSVHYVK